MDIFELVQPSELVGVVRQLQFPTLSLARFFPRQVRTAIDYSFVRGNEDALAAAPFRAFDAEAPIGSRPGVTRVVGQLPPISQKIILTEGDRLMLEQLFRGSASENEIVDAIFADAARMVRSVEARVELARGDALVDGVVSIDENGMQFEIDYGVPGTHLVTAADSWEDTSVDILGELRSWVQTYVDDNGFAPGRVITSTLVLGYMLQNDAIRDLANVGTATIVSRDVLGQILNAFGLPPVETYDVQVYDSTGTKVRVIPEDMFIMLPEGDEVLGQTQYGTTAEALELAGEGLLPTSDVPGIVAVSWKTKDPVHIWTKGAAIALPIIVNPDLLFTASVLPEEGS
jgi:hypothetical protein